MAEEGRIRMRCPNCGKIGRGKPSYLDREMTCPNCKQKVRFVRAKEDSIAEATPSWSPDAGRDRGEVRGETEKLAAMTRGQEQGIHMPVWIGEPASRGRRWAEYMIDMGLIRVVGFVVSLFLFLLCDVDVSNHPFFFGIAVFLLYYVSLEGTSGRTIGKMLLRTRVVGEDGQGIDAATAFLRSLIRFIPLEPLSVFGSTRRMWHDRWTHTAVVSSANLTLAHKLLVGVLVFLLMCWGVGGLGGLRSLVEDFARERAFQELNGVGGLPAVGRPHAGIVPSQEADLRRTLEDGVREGFDEAGPFAQFYSEGCREASAKFFADYLPDLTQRHLGKTWTEITAADAIRLGGIVAEQAGAKGLARLRAEKPELVATSEDIMVELAAENLTLKDAFELQQLLETPDDRLTSSQMARMTTLMEKLVEGCGDGEKQTLTEYFSSGMLMGLDGLGDELERGEIQ